MEIRRKILLKLLIVLIFGLVLITGVIRFASDMQKAKPVLGFLTLLEGKDICSLAIDGDTIWAGGSNGLYKISYIDKKAKTINKNYEFIGKDFLVEKVGDFRYIKAVLVSDGKVWIGHDEGVSIYDGKNFAVFTKDKGLSDNRVNALFKALDGQIYAGTWGGVTIFNDEKIVKTIKKQDGLLEDMVNVISQDIFGRMWFGSYIAPRGGISILYDNKWQYFTTKDALLHSNINAIINTRDQGVIVGGGLYTQGGGTKFRYDTQTGLWMVLRKFIKEDGLAGAKIRSLLEDSKGRLWIGSEYEGLAILSGEKNIILTRDSGLSNDEVKDFIEEGDGTIWVGTREGLVRIDKGGVINVN